MKNIELNMKDLTLAMGDELPEEGTICMFSDTAILNFTGVGIYEFGRRKTSKGVYPYEDSDETSWKYCVPLLDFINDLPCSSTSHDRKYAKICLKSYADAGLIDKKWADTFLSSIEDDLAQLFMVSSKGLTQPCVVLLDTENSTFLRSLVDGVEYKYDKTGIDKSVSVDKISVDNLHEVLGCKSKDQEVKNLIKNTLSVLVTEV
jgi:hypothetical protein